VRSSLGRGGFFEERWKGKWLLNSQSLSVQAVGKKAVNYEGDAGKKEGAHKGSTGLHKGRQRATGF